MFLLVKEGAKARIKKRMIRAILFLPLEKALEKKEFKKYNKCYLLFSDKDPELVATNNYYEGWQIKKGYLDIPSLYPLETYFKSCLSKDELQSLLISIDKVLEEM